MSTTKKTELDELDAVIEEEVEEKPKKAAPVKKTPKKYAPGDRIECRSVTGGELFLVGPKSQLLYTWEDYNVAITPSKPTSFNSSTLRSQSPSNP